MTSRLEATREHWTRHPRHEDRLSKQDADQASSIRSGVATSGEDFDCRNVPRNLPEGGVTGDERTAECFRQCDGTCIVRRAIGPQLPYPAEHHIVRAAGHLHGPVIGQRVFRPRRVDLAIGDVRMRHLGDLEVGAQQRPDTFSKTATRCSPGWHHLVSA